MAAKKIGTIIKEARAKKGLTQAQLAEAVDGLSASDIGKIERGEKTPTAAQAKQMAKPLGVTQASLVEALPASAKTASAGKTTAAKTSSSGKTSTAKTSSSAKTAAAKKTSSAKTSGTAKKTSSAKTTAAKKTSSNTSGTSVKLTATEKKLVEAYRGANSSTKKAALNLLSGKMGLEDITAILIAAKSSSDSGSSTGTSSSSSGSSNTGSAVSSVLQNIFGKLLKSGPENASSPLDQLISELQSAAPAENADELVLLEE